MAMDNSKFGWIKALWIGIKAGIISSLCCIPVIILLPILVFLGVESFTLAFALTKYRIYFIILGFLFVLLSIRAALRRKYGCCDTKTVLKSKYIIAIALITQISFFLISYYVVLPTVANYVFMGGLGSQSGEGEYSAMIVTTTISTTLPTSTLSETVSSTTTVLEETCFDGIQNQGEERIDCGGPCIECGTIGVSIGPLSECSSLRYNEVYLNLIDFGVGTKTWGDKNPVDSFELFCDNQSAKNFIRLERKSYEDYFGPTNMFRKSIVGEYRLLVACNREYFIKNLYNCSTLKVRVSKGSEWGEGVWRKKFSLIEVTTSTITILSTIPLTTTTLKSRFPGYSKVTLKLSTYCPTCIPAASYLLKNTKGVISAKFPDPKKKLWIITYNQNVTNPDRIMSRVRDFDPIVVKE